MTERKSFKRAVRARMQKTGERYTAARRHLSDQDSGAPTDHEVEPPTSDAAVTGATGKTWDEWFALLDEWGARERSHSDIAGYVQEKYGVSGWWAQSVAVGYERARGIRAKHQRPDGRFFAGASKTIRVPVDVLFEAVVEEGARRRWLPDAPLKVRTATKPKSARFDWGDGSTRVNMGFGAKGDSKSSVSLEHERLPDHDEMERMKAYWKDRLAALKRMLEE